MAYVVTRRWGGDDSNLPFERFGEVLAELAEPDDEHPDVALKHESEWALSNFRSGLLVFENVEESDAPPRHMRNVAPERVIELWKRLAEGDLAFLERLAWSAGYG
jgi:hypothetical protein